MNTNANKPKKPTIIVIKKTKKSKATASIKNVDNLIKTFKILFLPIKIKIYK